MKNKIDGLANIHAFLDEWFAMGRVDIENVFNESNVAILYKIKVDLTGDAAGVVVNNVNSFYNEVERLSKISEEYVKRWNVISREANSLLKEGDLDNAVILFDDFIKNCKSMFFREIMEAYKEEEIESFNDKGINEDKN